MWFYQKQPFVVDALLFVEIKFFRIYNGAMLTYFIAAAAFALIIFLLNLYIKFKSLENKNSEIKARKIRSENAQKKGLLVSCPICGSSLLPG